MAKEIDFVTTPTPDRLPRSTDGRGKLYIVGTPIGNLEDMTFRAIRILKEADLIACEDTRRTQKLLNHFEIHTSLISYHEHNEMTRAPELIISLEEGSDIALVSDAGMPVISDPGYRLVKLAIRHNIQVIPIPGASAFVASLAAAGLPVDKFRFLGFLPFKKNARVKALKDLRGSPKTLVFYEAPHRVMEMLEDVRKVLDDPDVVLAREVTKAYEEFVRGTASEVLEGLSKKTVKGEITVLVGPQEQAATADKPRKRKSEEPALSTQLAAIMKEQDLDERAALKVLARRHGVSRSEVYRQVQSEKSLS
jgi:16S rRNA (cytidine1402-2'-O)-methyltransferase